MYSVPFLSMIIWQGPAASLNWGNDVLNTTLPVLS
jgi:hypothetical protein